MPPQQARPSDSRPPSEHAAPGAKDSSHWLILSAVGLLGGLGHYFVARAFLWGEASILSPFQYAQLIGAAWMGYLAFGDVPSGWTWGGATVVTASGLYIAWQESQRPPGVRAASRT